MSTALLTLALTARAAPSALPAAEAPHPDLRALAPELHALAAVRRATLAGEGPEGEPQRGLRAARAELVYWSATAEQARAEAAALETWIAQLPGIVQARRADTDAAAALLDGACPEGADLRFASLGALRGGGLDPDAALAEAQRRASAVAARCPAGERPSATVWRYEAALLREAEALGWSVRVHQQQAALDELIATADQAAAAASAAAWSVKAGEARLAHAPHDPQPAKAAQLAARADGMIDAVEAWGGRLPAEDWCALWVGAGTARALAGRPDAADAFAPAAAAWNGACRGGVAAWMDIPEVQSAWSEALHRGSTEAAAVLVVDLAEDAWEIDGQPLRGLGARAIPLRAGLHRLAVPDPDGPGTLAALVEGLAPGRAWQLSRSGDAVRLVDLGPAGEAALPAAWALTEAAQAAPAPLRELPDPDLEAPGPAGKVDLGASALWHRFDARDHLGVRVAARYQLRSWGPWSLTVGLAHDQLQGENRYRYNPSFSTSALLRERALVGGGRRVGPLGLGAELGLGTIFPNNGLITDLAARVEWQPTARLRLQLDGGAGLHTWAGPPVPPTAQASAGLHLNL
jgi:hypothetical protein